MPLISKTVVQEPNRCESFDRRLIFLFSFYISGHLILLVFDHYHPDALMSGDRAVERLANIKELVDAINGSGNIIEVITSRALIGDYIFHAIAYLLGGKLGVLIAQTVFSIVGTYYVFRIAELLTRSFLISAICSTIFFLLPLTLIQPHLLQSEGFSNPLIIISFYFLTRYIVSSEKSGSDLVYAAISIGFSILIRPIVILLPCIVLLAVAVESRANIKKYFFRYATIAYLPIVLWMFLMFFATGEFTMGKYGGSMGNNLYNRVTRMLVIDPHVARPAFYANEGHTVSLKGYLEFSARNPKLFVGALKFDFINMFVNSGANNIFGGNYLAFYETDQDLNKEWIRVIDQDGVVRGVVFIFSQAPGLIILTVLSTAIWLLIFAGSIVGFVGFAKHKSFPVSLRIIYVLFPVYVAFFTINIAGAVRAANRSPFDFIICIMFAWLIYSQLKKPNIGAERLSFHRH